MPPRQLRIIEVVGLLKLDRGRQGCDLLTQRVQSLKPLCPQIFVSEFLNIPYECGFGFLQLWQFRCARVFDGSAA